MPVPPGRTSDASKPAVRIVPLQQLSDAPAALLDKRADAVLAEDQQLEYALENSPRGALMISLRGLQPESQAFALSPRLAEPTVARINRGLSQLKRQGIVQQLQRQAVNKS